MQGTKSNQAGKSVNAKSENRYLKRMCLRDLQASAFDSNLESENARGVNISA